ncbi:MAG TPA: hypothetical protein VF845_14365, partial [Terriglobales bacterium]
RYSGTTGTLDTTFNGTGIATLPTTDFARNVKIFNGSSPDELLVAANNSLFLLDASGAVDASFGPGGSVTANLSELIGAIDSQNRVVVAGVAEPSPTLEFMGVARFTSTGLPDLVSFCCGGTVELTSIPFSGETTGVAVDPFGNILGLYLDQLTKHTMLVRFRNDGQLDTSFGNGGVVDQIPPFDPLSFNQGFSIVVGGDGNIVLASGGADFVLHRYLGKSTQADLKLTKQASATAVAGGTINYSITVSNAGPDDASGVIITDPLPAGTTFVAPSCTAAAGATCSLQGSTLTINIPTLPNTASATVTFQATVDPTIPDGTVLSNTATVQFNGTNLDPTNSASATTAVLNRADLAVTIQQSPATVLLGGVITYSITLTNNGPATASNVVVNDSQPGGVAFTSCTGVASGCTLSPGSATINIPSLPSGSSAVITITGVLVSGSDGAVVANTVSVTSATPDPISANNSATATFTINNKADVAVGVAVTKLMNRQLSYVISVKNGGPFPAGQLLLNNAIPKGTVFVSAAPGAWSCTVPPPGGSGTVTCRLANLASGGVQDVTVVLKALSSTTMVSNTATVSAATFDPNTVNNTATLSTKASGN